MMQPSYATLTKSGEYGKQEAIEDTRATFRILPSRQHSNSVQQLDAKHPKAFPFGMLYPLQDMLC